MPEIPEAMLASNFEDTKHDIQYFIDNEWVIQEKSDGFRALIAKSGSSVVIAGRTNSRTKKRSFYTESCPEIVEFFQHVPFDFILDAEMVSSDFNSIASKARTQKTVVHDPNFSINVFDILHDVDGAIAQLPHRTRFKALNEFHLDVLTNWAYHHKSPSQFFKVIPQAKKPILSQTYLDKALAIVTERGGEGLIIKNPEAAYQPGKRSKDWLKVLPYRETDVVYLQAFEGEGKYVGTLGGFKAILQADEPAYTAGDSSKVFGVGTGFTDEQRHQYWAASHQEGFLPISGKIKYKELQPSGTPRMPVFLSFNADKE